ncbi:MAG: exosortase/archaeosortase family protein [Candidatus Acidiferrales bacterium]
MYAAKATPTQTSARKFGRRDIVFVLIVLACVGLYWNPLTALVSLCLRGDSYSHILLIPFIVLYLVISERGRIFREVHSAIAIGTAAIVAGVLISYGANARFYANGDEHLSGTILGLVLVCVGCFVACYGTGAARSAIFPLSFLLLIIPPPQSLLSPIVAALQHGSVAVSCLLFKLFGVPVFQKGVLLSVPGVTIEVAKECSSIRSSVALLITCILAARFYLRSFWRQALFVAVSLPLSVIKNGIRIITLTLLSIYVNPGFLHGDLHRDGGFVFFFLALIILWPVLSILRHSEAPALHNSGKVAPSGELAGS